MVRQRYILKTRPKLSAGCTRPTLLLYCFAMASHGINGLDCFASDATVAEELGMYDYRSVRPYRLEAVKLGWFVWTGKRHGRAKVLDISIPADDTLAGIPAKPAVTDAKSKPGCNCFGCFARFT